MSPWSGYGEEGQIYMPLFCWFASPRFSFVLAYMCCGGVPLGPGLGSPWAPMLRATLMCVRYCLCARASFITPLSSPYMSIPSPILAQGPEGPSLLVCGLGGYFSLPPSLLEKCGCHGVFGDNEFWGIKDLRPNMFALKIRRPGYRFTRFRRLVKRHAVFCANPCQR